MLDLVQQYPESTFCFLIVLFCLMQAWVLKKDFFKPANVYVFTQCLTLGIAFLKFDKAMTDFHWLTWLVWGGALVAFVLGTSLFHLVAPKAEFLYEQRKSFSEWQMSKSYNWNTHFRFSLFLLFLFFVGIVGIVSKVGTLIVFAADTSKYTGFNSGLGIYDEFRVLSSLALLLFTISAFHKGNKNKFSRYFSRVMLLFIPIMSLLTFPARNILLMNCAFILLGWNFFVKRIPVKGIVLAMALGVAFFVGVASLRDQYGNSVQKMAAKHVMLLPYRYIANNYWNLDYILNRGNDQSEHPLTLGFDMAGYMLHYSLVATSFRESVGWKSMFSSSVMKVGGYNTVVYLWEVYKEWGIVGVLLFPFFLAFILEWLYYKRALGNNLIYTPIYILSLYELGMLFFCNGFKFPNYWLWLYILMILGVACKKRELKLNQFA